MKTPTLAALAVASLFALAACNPKPTTEVVDANPDPMANTLANSAPVALPPSIEAEKSMRCKDNSLAYVTFFHGGKQVVVRTEKDGTPTTLTGETEGGELTAPGGWAFKGNLSNITLTRPGKPALTCKA